LTFKEIFRWTNRHSRESGNPGKSGVMDCCFRRNDRTLDSAVIKTKSFNSDQKNILSPAKVVHTENLMTLISQKDNGGRRSRYDRRIYLLLSPVLEKRRGRDRRSGIDRRTIQISKFKPQSERRKAFG